ncbi:MAG TPA: serine hydrolase [Flavisolibacter sp.]|nr:serine hydrolase [Flavisolibacter sp.]
MRRHFLLLTIFVAFAYASIGQALLPSLDSLVSVYVKQRGFNGSVLVAQKGKVLLEKGYGYKDAAKRTMLDENSIFQYGSITKQFTSALVMYLQEKGKLNINDKLSRYFPELPFADSVTLYNLLTHTSGIYNYTNNGDFMKTEAVKPATREKIFNLFDNKPLEFKPGTKFNYSNSGYSLLGYIIEKASGMPYEKLMRQVILEPVGMKTAGFDYAHSTSADRTTGYNFINGDKFEAAGIVDSTVAYAAGSLYGSVKDLYAWHQALEKHALLSAASWQKVYTPFQSKYAMGWGIDSAYGKLVTQHGGGIFGYTSMIRRFPEDDVVVIVLSNNSSQYVGEIANNLSAIIFRQPIEWPKEHKFVKVAEEKLKAYVGEYEVGPNFILKISVDNGMLQAEPTGQPKTELQAESEDTFYIAEADAQLVFEKDSAGKVTGARLIQQGRVNPIKKIK